MNRTVSALTKTAALLGALGLLAAPPARAFKPITHVALANIAVEDAIDDGHVSIYRIDTGAKVGDFEVDQELLTALRSRYLRAHYTAGVVGPDGLPDLLTGQQIIHVSRDEGGGPNGSDSYLKHMWINSRSANKGVKAFVAGFLTHAAGDMYMHQFVNHFAGGPFVFPLNAIRHLVFEGYIAKVGPMPNSYGFSIGRASTWLYQNLIRWQPGTPLARLVERTRNSARSFGWVFSKLRKFLEEEVRSATPSSVATSIAGVMVGGAVAFTTAIVASVAWRQYAQSWINDIDAGLQALPAVSERVTKALMFNSRNQIDLDDARAALEQYKRDHVLKMVGLPGWAASIIGGAEMVAAALRQIPQAYRDFILRLRVNFANFFLERLLGTNVAEMQRKLTNPELFLNEVMATPAGNCDGIPVIERATFLCGHSNAPPTPHITVERLKSQYLHISGRGPWDYRRFPPAYNAVVMSKLILVKHSEIDRLLRLLGGTAMPKIDTGRRQIDSNVMLGGFMQTLDGAAVTHGGQWVNPGFVFRAPAVYNKLFLAVTSGTGGTDPARARMPPDRPSTPPAASGATSLCESEPPSDRPGEAAMGPARTAGPTHPSGLIVEEGKFRPGDTRRSISEFPNKDACVAACAESRDCRAFSWQDSNRCCWLKDSVGRTRTQSGFVSGYKP